MLKLGILSMFLGGAGVLASIVAAAYESELLSPVIQCGALGLVGLMVVLQSSDRRSRDADFAVERKQWTDRMDTRDLALLEMQKMTVEACKDLMAVARGCRLKQGVEP